MKISGLVIQNKNITINTTDDFNATYKGKEIVISTNHGFGDARWNHLNRYNILVIDKTGIYDVDTYQDLYNMQDAIRYALKGCNLLKI